MFGRRTRQEGGLAGIAGSLHIKKRTAGTSNEISVSILEERSSKAGLSKSGPRDVFIGDLGSGVSAFGSPDGKGATRSQASSGTLPSLPRKARFAENGSKKAMDAPARLSVFARLLLGAADAAQGGSSSEAFQASRGSSGPAGSLASAFDLQREVERRKAARRRRRLVLSALMTGVLVVAIGAAGVYAHGRYVEYQETMGLLHQGMSELQAADVAVVPMDQAIVGDVTAGGAAGFQDLIDQIDAAEVHLNAAKGLAEESYDQLSDSESKEAASQVIKAADARLEMLGYGKSILQEDMKASDAIALLGECWATVGEADDAMRESARLVEDTTEANTKESEEKSKEAQTLFEKAKDQLEVVKTRYPAAGLDAVGNYIDKRIEEIGYAIASDEAIYIQDKATADAQNERYNEADDEAVSIADGIPKRIENVILDQYDLNVKDANEGYFTARSDAAAADSFLREYLGISQ